MTHTLGHALEGCTHEVADITACVICGRGLPPIRNHVDTCGAVCFRKLYRLQVAGRGY